MTAKCDDPRPWPRWQVVVGSLGQIFDDCDEAAARGLYADYVRMSREGLGRVGGASVTLLRDGVIVDDHDGWGRTA